MIVGESKNMLIARVWALAGGLLIVGGTLVVVGCNQGVPLGTVEGRVTKNGQPQPGLWVQFKPEVGRPGEGRTNRDGRFELVYSQHKMGALVGRNRVTIYSGGETDSRDNELTPRVEIFRKEVDVESGANTFDFELESK